MLRIERLSYSIPSGNPEAPFHVLRDINLTVRNGEFLSIVGPNGCGKTTLLRLIAGLIGPTEGHLIHNDKKIFGPGSGVGMVFQEMGLLPWKTVRGNIAFGLAHTRELRRKQKSHLVDQYLFQFGLKEFEHSYPHQLSGGMKQKVAIARTLINEADVLLMDEPFGALDCLTRNSLQEFLLPVWQNSRSTIIFVTHNVDEAVFLSQRIIIMSRNPGRILREIEVDLPYPRKRTDEQCQRIRGDILSLLVNEIQCFDFTVDLTRFSSYGD